MLSGAVRSFLFGVALASAVGPIALLILTYGVRSGIRTAAAAGLGAAVADLLFALVAFFLGSALLVALTGHERAVKMFSAFVLAAVGLFMMVRAARSVPRADPVPPPRASRPLVTTLLLTLVNPMTIVTFTSFAAQLPVSTSRLATILFALSLFLGSLMVQMTFAIGGATLSRFVSRPGWLRALNISSGAAIAAFGIAGLMDM